MVSRTRREVSTRLASNMKPVIEGFNRFCQDAHIQRTAGGVCIFGFRHRLCRCIFLLWPLRESPNAVAQGTISVQGATIYVSPDRPPIRNGTLLARDDGLRSRRARKCDPTGEGFPAGPHSDGGLLEHARALHRIEVEQCCVATERRAEQATGGHADGRGLPP